MIDKDPLCDALSLADAARESPIKVVFPYIERLRNSVESRHSVDDARKQYATARQTETTRLDAEILKCRSRLDKAKAADLDLLMRTFFKQFTHGKNFPFEAWAKFEEEVLRQRRVSGDSRKWLVNATALHKELQAAALSAPKGKPPSVKQLAVAPTKPPKPDPTINLDKRSAPTEARKTFKPNCDTFSIESHSTTNETLPSTNRPRLAVAYLTFGLTFTLMSLIPLPVLYVSQVVLGLGNTAPKPEREACLFLGLALATNIVDAVSRWTLNRLGLLPRFPFSSALIFLLRSLIMPIAFTFYCVFWGFEQIGPALSLLFVQSVAYVILATTFRSFQRTRPLIGVIAFVVLTVMCFIPISYLAAYSIGMYDPSETVEYLSRISNLMSFGAASYPSGLVAMRFAFPEGRLTPVPATALSLSQLE